MPTSDTPDETVDPRDDPTEPEPPVDPHPFGLGNGAVEL